MITMASKGIHQLNGVVAAGATDRIILDDGDFKSVMEIIDLKILANKAAPATVVLSTDPDTVPGAIDVADNRQIGWIESIVDSGGLPVGAPQIVLTPGRLLFSDLFLTNLAAGGEIGYSITMKRKKVSAAAALVAIIKERAQDLP